MRYRIVKIMGKYRPQYKCFFWWENFEEGTADWPVERGTVSEAEQYIESRKKLIDGDYFKEQVIKEL